MYDRLGDMQIRQVTVSLLSAEAIAPICRLPLQAMILEWFLRFTETPVSSQLNICDAVSLCLSTN
jgi:hypothetical protein